MFYYQKIKKIRNNNGATAKFSVAEITFHIVNLAQAKMNFSIDVYHRIKTFFNIFIQLRDKNYLNYHGFIECSTQIIANFDMIAPYYKFCGDEQNLSFTSFIDEEKQPYREKVKLLFDEPDVNSIQWWERYNNIFQEFKQEFYY